MFLKAVMAVTGIIFVVFVLLHMYGNLKVFAGEAAFNDYAHGLRTIGEPELPWHGALDIIEIILGISVVLHVWAAFVLWKRAVAARPQRYVMRKRVAQTMSSKWMRWAGIAILLFVAWHLLQFTFFKINVGSGGQVASITDNPYQLYVHAFQVWWMTLIYLAAMLALGLHIRHGVWSASETLGWTSTPAARLRANVIGYALAIIIAVGFVVPPLFVVFGAIS